MKEEPKVLSRALIATTLAERWGIDSQEIAYLPVGGGGHHWRVQGGDSSSWFVTANGLLARGHWLERAGDAVYARTYVAYETTRRLGLDFALAAVPDRYGSVLCRIHSDWALSVYPYLEGIAADEKQLVRTIAGYVGTLHAMPVPADVPTWRSELPQRGHLERALADLHQPSWAAGPFGNPTRALLTANRTRVLGLLDRYDELASVVDGDAEPWVLTHGEPHAGNTLPAADGMTYLIDWDTLAFAPRERDLWQLMDTPSGPVWDAYRATSGHPRAAHPDIMEFFRLWWRLVEMGDYVRQFRSPHVGDADDNAAWKTLEAYVGEM
ncbi:MAG TPA: phosphotransferase [Mycobacteriales bacterium]|nr:phosphotransferase [Mycobacteriales bacterium]